ncbi:MAG TPA: MerR family transcriptional regulator [Pseudonocardiaceae bacterium]|nr:MerR family transcriptional regulator [Pseudonocardiaceae bacterium]
MTDPRLSVGHLARRSGLTAKALRHYDRIGLLRPAAVDPDTGYRWYSLDQVAEARLVWLLRSVELPLDAVRAAVTAWQAGDTESLARILRRQRQLLDARTTRLRGALHRINHLISEGIDMTEPDPATHATPSSPPGTGTVTDERLLASQLFNQTWRLLEQEQRSTADDDRMIHTAHASRYHWGQVPTATPAHLARGEWQVSRVYAVLGRSEPALHHAQRVLDICLEHGIGDWDLAFAYEALARASAVLPDAEAARGYTDKALAAAEAITEDEDRDLLLADLETMPGQPRYW